MQNRPTNSFEQELQQRGLIEKAHSVCASWQDGFVAQDADGAVFAYNTAIAPMRQGWQPTPKGTGQAMHCLAKLTATELWQDHVLPMRAVWQWQPGLNAEQQLFYRTLLNNGVVGKTKIFLTTWEKDIWIAMDANGAIYLYNCQPNKGTCMWLSDRESSDLNDSMYLEKNGDLRAAWDESCIKLSVLETPCPPVATGPIILPKLNIRDRMDCWI
jgi:hypothetical protein